MTRGSRLRIWCIATAIFALITANIVLAWRTSREGEEAEFRLQTGMAAAQFARRLEDYINTRIDVLEVFADDWVLGNIGSRADYERSATKIVQRFPGFLAVNWVDPEGVIRWIAPVEGNEAALNRSIVDRLGAPGLYEQARLTGRTQMTPPIQLFQGGLGQVVLVPLRGLEGRAGYINGVFRLDTLIDQALGEDEHREFAFAIHDNGEAVYSSASRADIQDAPYRADTPVRIHNRQWRLTVAPSPAYVDEIRDPNNDEMLVGGVLLTAALTVFFGLFLERQERLNRQAMQLVESEQRYRTLSEVSPVGVFRNTVDGRCVYVNDRACKFTGLSRETLLGDGWIAALHPDDRARVLESWREAMQQHAGWRMEYRFLHADGEVVWVLAQQTPDYDPNGAITGFVGTLTDITERKEAEMALRESEQHFLGILNQTSFAVVIHREGKVLFQNPAVERLTGYTPADLDHGTTVADILTEESQQRVLSIYRARLAGEGVPDRYEVEFVRKDGSHSTAEVSVNSIDFRDEPALMVTMFDTTERRRAERALRAAHRRLRVHMERTPLGYISLDRNGCVTQWNPAAEHIFGFTRDEMLGQDVFRAIVPEDVQRELRKMWRMVLGGAKNDQRVNDNVTKDGRRITCQWINTVLFDDHDEPVGVASFVRDITEERRLEAERRLLATAVEQTGESVLITNTDSIIEYVNPAFEKLSGYPADEVIGRSARELRSGVRDRAVFREIWAKLKQGDAWQGRLTHHRKDGSTYEVDTVISPLRDETGRVVRYVAVETDATERVKLEAQFRQAQKMEALGTLAGGIAHDFNNLLTGILGGVQLAMLDVAQDSPLMESLHEVHEAAERAAELTKQLLTLSRRQEPQVGPMDLNETVLRTVRLLRRSIPESINVQTILDNAIPTLGGDSGQISHALLNLGINARDAMPDGGELTFGTRLIELSEEDAAQYPDGRAGQFAVIEVTDSGHGMSPDVLERIFEPFFTTKEAGQGTGLGLAMVYGCLRAHNGWVTAYSQVGRGTTFHLYLPIVRVEERREIPERRTADLPRGTETVLLVDDMETVLAVGKSILERCGYTVHAAHDGEEALTFCERDNGALDLVVTDLVMPRCGGRDLLKRLRARNLTMPVIVTSGYAPKSNPAALLAEGFAEFVAKPFEGAELAHAVRRVLNAASGSETSER